MSQKLLVSGGAAQGRFSDPTPSQRGEFGGDKGFQRSDDARVDLGIGDDTRSAIDLLLTGLELGFDQRNNAAADPQKSGDGWQDELQADEGTVGHSDVQWSRGSEVIEGQAPCVGSFQDDHPGVLPEFPRQLSMTDIDRMHRGRSVLEKAVGETSGASTEIDALETLHGQGEVLQCVLKLVAAP